MVYAGRMMMMQDAVPGQIARQARELTLALLATRAEEATICPSEVARALAAGSETADDWRSAMPAVHAAIDRLVAEGSVQLSWKRQPLEARAGPYRIGRAPRG